MTWDDLVPTFLVLVFAVVAPTASGDLQRQRARAEPPEFLSWIYYTPNWYDGKFRPCTDGETVALVCAIAHGDDP